MADRNQLRIDRDFEFAESDPLAELTRIMGFDPRVEPAPPMENDLVIDLERELMGEFESALHDDASVDHSPAAESAPADPALAPSYEGAFDDALAASLEEEFTSASGQWLPETGEDQASGPSVEPEIYAAGDAADVDIDIDIDFSGQLSPVADEQAELAGERFLEETAAAAAEEIPDIEAELGELLGALGASHQQSRAPADAEAARIAPEVGETHDFSAEDLPYSVHDDQEASAAVDSSDESEPAKYDAYPDLNASSLQFQPRDEILDQFYGHPEAEIASEEEILFVEGAFDAHQNVSGEGVGSESVQTPEADFLADSEAEPTGEIFAKTPTRDAEYRLPELEATGASLDASFEASDEIGYDGPAQQAEESIFDEGEFEAAFVGEFEADDFAPDPVDATGILSSELEAREEPRDDPFAGFSSTGSAQPGVPATVHADDGYDAGSARDDDFAVEDETFAEEDGAQASEFDATTPGAVSLAPEIETVEVVERAVALADDLDLPEIRFESDVPPAAAYDDLDSGFSGAFSELNAQDAAHGGDRAVETAPADPFDSDFDRLFEDADFGDDGSHAAAVAGASSAPHYGVQPAPRGYETAHASAAQQPASDDRFQAGDEESLVYDPAYDGEIAESPASAEGQPSRNRGFVVAAVVAGLAFAGGVGAFAYSLGGGDDGAPALVRADTGPVKIRPENPGGAVVPNQDSKVYERVSGGPIDAPSQEKLISGSEEPVELAVRPAEPVAASQAPAAVEGLPGVDLAPIGAAAAEQASLPKAEDRVAASPDIESVIANDEVAAVAPRRVRTMIVRPDGTMVPREDPAPVASQQPVPGSEAGSLELPAAAPAPALAPISAQPAEAVVQPAVAEIAPAVAASPAILPAAEQPATPPSVLAAPSRPGAQPVEIVGEVRPRGQVASLEPEAPAAAAGTWMMQIASQPSPEGAQASYENLASRYGGILSGRGVNIVKAEIAGKGTFWRVRIPAASRSDAVELCESYKGAGGSCFVSQ